MTQNSSSPHQTPSKKINLNGNPKKAVKKWVNLWKSVLLFYHITKLANSYNFHE